MVTPLSFSPQPVSLTAIQSKTPGIHHIALRCLDFARAKAFYQYLLGFPMVLEIPEVMGCLIGSVFMGFKQAAPMHPADTIFTPFNIGLDLPRHCLRGYC
ncbi:MAG: VOC family protein [Janthinobacterium lividum]